MRVAAVVLGLVSLSNCGVKIPPCIIDGSCLPTPTPKPPCVCPGPGGTSYECGDPYCRCGGAACPIPSPTPGPGPEPSATPAPEPSIVPPTTTTPPAPSPGPSPTPTPSTAPNPQATPATCPPLVQWGVSILSCDEGLCNVDSNPRFGVCHPAQCGRTCNSEAHAVCSSDPSDPSAPYRHCENLTVHPVFRLESPNDSARWVYQSDNTYQARVTHKNGRKTPLEPGTYRIYAVPPAGYVDAEGKPVQVVPPAQGCWEWQVPLKQKGQKCK